MSIYNTLTLSLTLLKLFGLAPYTLKKPFRTTRNDLIFSALAIMCNSYLIVGGIFTCGTRNHGTTTVSSATTFAHRLFNVILPVTITVFTIIHKQKLTDSLRVIDKADVYLRKISGKLNVKSGRRRSLLTVAVTILAIFTLFATDLPSAFTNMVPLGCTVSYCLSYTSTLVFECHLMVIFSELRLRFNILNRHIVKKNLEDLQHLKDYSEVFGELVDAGRLFNEYCQGQILVKLISTFFFITSSLYFVGVEGFIFDNKDTNVEELLSFWIYGIINVLEVYGIIYGCVVVEEECWKFEKIIAKFDFRKANKRLIQVMDIFAYQVGSQKITFSAFDMFPINFTAIYTFIIGVFTYLVILVQLT